VPTGNPEPTTVAEILETARGNRTLGDIASAAKLSRSWVVRAFAGSRGRTKVGRRTAEHDPRWLKLAAALGIKETGELIDAVVREQTAPAVSRRMDDPLDALLREVWPPKDATSAKKRALAEITSRYFTAAKAPDGIRRAEAEISRRHRQGDLPGGDGGSHSKARPTARSASPSTGPAAFGGRSKTVMELGDKTPCDDMTLTPAGIDPRDLGLIGDAIIRAGGTAVPLELRVSLAGLFYWHAALLETDAKEQRLGP
jgi:hypothetical protein